MSDAIRLADVIDTLPKCLIYDGSECEFSNGDSIYTENEYAYQNAYIVELAYTDHTSGETWDGISLLVRQGRIDYVTYYALDIDEDGYEYVDECHVDASTSIATPLYMDAVQEWKAFYLACTTLGI